MGRSEWMENMENPLAVRLALLLSMLAFLTGCAAERRDRDMTRFFREHLPEMVQVQDALQRLWQGVGIRGYNLGDDKVYLAGIAVLSMAEARERFKADAAAITQVGEMEKKLGLKSAYLLEDGSFWVIVDEADLFGSDFGFLREGRKKAASYRILDDVRPMPDAAGWHLIRF